MPGHLPELLIILVLALVVFGPEKFPEVAQNTGKFVRDLRSGFEEMMHPEDREMGEDFSTYYYESLSRAGEDVPEAEVFRATELEPIHFDEEEASSDANGSKGA